MQSIRNSGANHPLDGWYPVPKGKQNTEGDYIQCQKPIKAANGWNTPAKIKVRENINDVIIAAVGALGVYD